MNQIERAESWGTRTVLLAASSLTVMAGATIAPALPAIERHFAGTGGDIPLLTRLALTFPALFIALFAPVAGASPTDSGGGGNCSSASPCTRSRACPAFSPRRSQ